MHELLKIEPRNVIISIKPEYALKIVRGRKTVELRRKFPTENINAGIAIIYASSPIKQVIGYAVIRNVQKLPISTIWNTYRKDACVTKAFFNSYFDGLEEGFAISLCEPIELIFPLSVKKLKEDYCISPPQSYCYASDKILKVLEV